MKNIYCKSSIELKQLDARRCLDKSGIELQLLADFVEEPKDIKEYITDIRGYVKDIKVVHAPLKSGEELIEVQMLSEEKYIEIFNRVCELGQAISNINDQSIIIVVHNAWSLKQYEYSTEKYIKIKECLEDALESNPGIRVAIENIIPHCPNRSGDFNNGSYPDYVELIKKLRIDIGTDRIGTVLDTCHAMVTIKIDSLLKSFGNSDEEVKIEEYYKVNKGICMLVHLCNVNELGYKKGQHGICFDESDKELLKELLSFHKKYIKDADITIEVLEDDYTDCKNYKKTKELLDRIMDGSI